MSSLRQTCTDKKKKVSSANEEHAVSRWRLKKENTFNDPLIAPRKLDQVQGSHKISCCKKCNDMMKKRIEDPVSEIFHSKRSLHDLNLTDRSLIYHWMLWMYIKDRIRGFRQKANPNPRSRQRPKFFLYRPLQIFFYHQRLRHFVDGNIVDLAEGSSLLTLKRVSRPPSPDRFFHF